MKLDIGWPRTRARYPAGVGKPKPANRRHRHVDEAGE